MSKRTRYILAAIIASILIAWIVVENLPPTPGVTQANFDRLEKGMTLAEVEAIFGKPSSDSFESGFISGNHVIVHRWVCPSGEFTFVHFSQHGVSYKSWPEADETIVRKIRKWLARELKTEAS